MNEREVKVKDLILCRACAEGSYYTEYVPADHGLFSSPMVAVPNLLSHSER